MLKPKKFERETDDSPFGVIRFAKEVILCFFLVTSRGGGVSGVPNSELAIRTTLIWAQKAQVTMVPGARHQFWITEATRFLTHGGFFDRPWYNQAVTLCFVTWALVAFSDSAHG